jgi:hypothetical protein
LSSAVETTTLTGPGSVSGAPNLPAGFADTMTALAPLQHPNGDGTETATEFAIDPPKFHDAFAADLPARQTAVMTATQRPVAESAFSEPVGPPAWKSVPSFMTAAAAVDRAPAAVRG